MGCHSWIYKKVKEIPTEEIKNDVMNAIAQIELSGKYSDDEREKWENVLEREALRYLDKFEKLKSEEGTTQKRIDDFAKEYGYIIAYADKFHRELKWNGRVEKYENAKNIAIKAIETCKFDSIKFYEACRTLDCAFNNFKKVDDEWYVCISNDLPFRVWRYPEQRFTDCDELLKFLKNHTEKFGDDVVSLYEADAVNVCREVKGYTKKLETAIREFWKEHNNSLFVEFG